MHGVDQGTDPSHAGIAALVPENASALQECVTISIDRPDQSLNFKASWAQPRNPFLGTTFKENSAFSR